MNARSSLFALLPILAASAAGCGAQVLDVGDTGKDKDPTQATTPGAGTDPTTGATPAFPASACVALGSTAKVLYTLPADVNVQNLVPQDDTLWVSGYTSAVGAAVVGQLERVPLHDGAPAAYPLDRFSRLAGFFANQLVYVRTTHRGSGTQADPNVEEVILHDLASSVSQVVPNPASTTYVSGVAVHASGIYWESRAWDATVPSQISRWTSSAAPTSLAAIDNYSSMVTDGKDVFYVRWADGGTGNVTSIQIEAVAVTGGAPRILRTYPYDQKFFYGVVAVDDTDVYFTQEATDSGGTIGAGDLRAMKKDGTGERVVSSDQKFGVASFHIDPDFVTWTDQDAQQTIVRVHRSGGALERIEGMANRWISAVAVDRCNLYYAVENPSEIYGRSRL